MSSNIDAAIPPLGAPTTAGVRANFAAAKLEIEALQGATGFADYNDALTAVTPISVSPSTWTKLTNNKLGPQTKIDALPSGVTNLWNKYTNHLALAELPVNTMIEIRVDLIVTTTTANQVVKLRTQFGIGSASEFSCEMSEGHFKTSGAKTIVGNFHAYIGNADIKNNPAEIRIWSDAACTVRVNGWFIRVIKKL